MNWRSKLALVAVGMLLFAVGSLYAQERCTTQTVKGTYGFICTGFVTPPGASAGALVPYAATGFAKGNKEGFVVAGGPVSIGGTQISFAPLSGQATVNPDCFGHVDYNVATPFELNVDFHVLDQGKEIRGYVKNPGYVVTCNLRLISRHTED